jgi:hypothetical protein
MRDALVVLVLTGLAAACSGGAYCQSGPVHGTQCYSPAEVRGADPTQPPVPPRHMLEPAKSAADAGPDPFMKK